MHQAGQLSDRNGDPVKPVIEYIAEMESLDGKEEIAVKEGFLQHVVNTYGEYFGLIGTSIEALEKN